MKTKFELIINAPREKVVALARDPEKRTQWMDGLESLEPISGTPGEPGAKSRLVFQTGNMKITFEGTVIERRPPDYFIETMNAPHVLVTIKSVFMAESPQTTRYISEQDYQFRGLPNQLIGFFLQGEFKKQTLTHMENFKRLVETS